MEGVEIPETGYGFGYRHIQAILLWFVSVMSYVIRTTMSVGIIAITDRTNSTETFEVYDWDKQTQGIILSSFFWGYTFNQIPSGQLIQRYGAKIVLALGTIMSGIIFTAMPFLISIGDWKLACICRMIQGMTQSALLPGTHYMLSKWVPSKERSRLGYMILAGAPVGTVVGMMLSGYLCGSFGWVKTFYIMGALSIIIGSVWFIFSHDYPSNHPRISKEEVQFIEESLGKPSNRRLIKTPWKLILTSMPFWALTIGQTGNNWSFVSMLLETPSYLKMALGINVQNSGIISSVPYIAMWTIGIIFSILADFIINRQYCTVTFTRKLMNTFASWGLAIPLVILTFISTTDATLCILVLILGIGLNSAVYVGVMLVHVDLAPNFAGVLMSITNTCANGVGMFAPIISGYILQDPADEKQWWTVFYVNAIILVVSNLIFQLFGSAERQPWNKIKTKTKDIEMNDVINGSNVDGQLLRKV